MTNPNHMKKPSKTLKNGVFRSFLSWLPFIVIILGIFYWQNRHLLNYQENNQTPQSAHTQKLLSLTGKTDSIIDPTSNQSTIVYFFAPWCSICDWSIGNLESQRKSLLEKNYRVVYVALSWETQEEVGDFATRNQLTEPVLLGTQSIMQDFKVKGFPTYYLINSDGKVISGSQGYSSKIGIWLRSL